jgi:hypothetical protein
LQRAEVLSATVSNSREAFLLLASVLEVFEYKYRAVIEAVVAKGLPVVVCTLYNANYPDKNYQRCVSMAVALYNDVMRRMATDYDLLIIDLRTVCTTAADFANPIEPSSQGGHKIAKAIVAMVTKNN